MTSGTLTLPWSFHPEPPPNSHTNKGREADSVRYTNEYMHELDLMHAYLFVGS